MNIKPLVFSLPKNSSFSDIAQIILLSAELCYHNERVRQENGG